MPATYENIVLTMARHVRRGARRGALYADRATALAGGEGWLRANGWTGRGADAAATSLPDWWCWADRRDVENKTQSSLF